MSAAPVLPPSGVVTLLFTDVEGSTRRWAADPEAMSASLRVHDGIPVLDRLVRLRASGSSLDALADEKQHLAAVIGKFDGATTREERFAVNRPKLDAEVARILDGAG